MTKYIVTVKQIHQIIVEAESKEEAEQKYNDGEGETVQQGCNDQWYNVDSIEEVE